MKITICTIVTMFNGNNNTDCESIYVDRNPIYVSEITLKIMLILTIKLNTITKKKA